MLKPASETLPARLYSDAALYQTERHEIFARSWQLFAHEGQLARPGDYLATDFAGYYPIVAVRRADGAVRAFHNVCRHRAGPLVEDGEGHCAGALVCRYHAWGGCRPSMSRALPGSSARSGRCWGCRSTQICCLCRHE